MTNAAKSLLKTLSKYPNLIVSDTQETRWRAANELVQSGKAKLVASSKAFDRHRKVYVKEITIASA